MSISITTSNELFNNKKNLIIVFSSFSQKIKTISRDNYVFIYGDNNLIGINIFDYKNDFTDIKEGYHNFSNINFDKIVKKFPKEMKEFKNDSFFKIGLISKIEKHPKSEKLKILSVNINKDIYQIVTNIDGLMIGNSHLFAMEKAFLASGTVIEKSKVMGIESQGMICSYRSIGIEKDGIILIQKNEELDEFNF